MATTVSIPGELGSRKFRAAVLASLLAFIGIYLKMDLKEIAVAISPLLMYIPAQGLADHGKSRALIENPKAPE